MQVGYQTNILPTPGDPLIKLLELRFVSSSSETSRSSGTIQTSQNSISSHPAFPDEAVCQFSPCARTAPILPGQASVITQMWNLALSSSVVSGGISQTIGLRIGILHAIVLIPSKHF